jgi:putative NADH-flavin reductase
MSKIVVFGAGGRTGRRVVAEAAARGHQVTAVVREPDRHPGLARAGARPVAGDVTQADSVASAAAGHDAAVNAAVRLDVPSAEFFVSAAHALLDGLGRAGVTRLVMVGIGTTLETPDGTVVHDTPGFPAEGREFSLGHTAELEVFRGAMTGLDWLVVAPPPVVLDDEAPGTGRYRIGGGQVLDDGPFSYADLAVALVDEAEKPAHHRTLAAVAAE